MNIHFGFSYIGLIFLLMLMLPNIIWSKNKPKGYDKYVKNENKVLLLLEWLGEMLVTCLSLIFSDFNIKGTSKNVKFPLAYHTPPKNQGDFAKKCMNLS